jgi:hypothetical protein
MMILLLIGVFAAVLFYAVEKGGTEEPEKMVVQVAAYITANGEKAAIKNSKGQMESL